MALKPCKECKKEVSDSAKRCPHCGVDHPTIVVTKTTSAIAAFAVIGLVGIFGLSICGKKETQSDATNAVPQPQHVQAGERNAAQGGITQQETHKPSQLEIPPTAITSAALYKAYASNEVRADHMYKERKLLVTGRFTGTMRDGKTAIAKLGGPDGNDAVAALIDIQDEWKLVEIKNGASIKLSCIGAGKYKGFPVLKDCLIATK